MSGSPDDPTHVTPGTHSNDAAPPTIGTHHLDVSQKALAPDSMAPVWDSAREGGRLGRYELRGQIGKGGMGVVYEAWDPELGRFVALKTLTMLGGLLSEDSAERLVREAKAAARLSHPGIVAIHDVGLIGGLHYFTMELVRGQSLEQALGRDGFTESTPIRRRVEIVAEVAEALGHAHAQGVVHRDVKPSNILLDATGRAKLSDFGIAKTLSSDEVRSLTNTGSVLGTPHYMSPEQAGGGSKDVGPASDVFSLGVVLYRVLSGVLPFGGEGMSGLVSVLQDEPPPPSVRGPNVHRDLDTLCMRCLEKEPSRRFPDGAALAGELRRYLAGEPILSRPTPWIARTWRRVIRPRVMALLGILGLAIGMGALGWVVYHAQGPDPQEVARAEAMSLLARARSMVDEAQQLTYVPGASYADLVEKADAGQDLAAQALDRVPGSAEAHVLRGLAWELKGWDDKAEACWRKAIELDPDCAMAHFHLGQRFLARAYMAMNDGSREGGQGDPKRAERLAWEGSKEFDASLSGKTSLGDTLERQVASAMLAYTRNDLEGAVEWCGRGLEKFPRARGREVLHWLLGEVKVRKKEPGLDDFRRATEIRPLYPLAVFAMATVHEDNQDQDLAVKTYDWLLEISPRFAEGLLNRGHIRFTRGDFRGAMSDYDAALAIDEKYTTALMNRSLVRRAQGDLERALADVDAALKYEPRYFDALNTRGVIRLERGDTQGAVDDFGAALDLRPNAYLTHVNRAIALNNLARYEEAKGNIERALKLGDPRPDVWLQLGNAHFGLGEIERAAEDYRRCLHVAPEGWPDRALAESALKEAEAHLHIHK